MTTNIITIGGSKDFTDKELAFKEIERIIKSQKIIKKDLIVYGYADGTTGAFTVAKGWAEKVKVKFADGSPKKGKDWNLQLAERNNALATHSKLLINLRMGAKTGGKGIIETFELKGVPVEIIDTEPEALNAGEVSNEVSDADLSPLALRKGDIPNAEDVKRNVAIYSKVAQKLLNYGCLMIDTETTGLKDDDEVIEIAISDCATGTPVFNSLIYADKTSNEFAFKVNKITREMLQGKPTIEEVWNQIEAIAGNRVLLASNSSFDERLLNQSLKKYGLTCSFIWQDIQVLYRNYSCQGSPTKYPLKTVGMCKQLGVEAGTHRAKDDVDAQIRLLKAMAEGVIPNFEV